VKAVHLQELRAALTPAFVAAGRGYGYTDTLVPGQTVIRAVHVGELRDIVRTIW